MDSEKLFTDKKFIIIFATLCTILWGSAFPAVKSGYSLFRIATEDTASKLVFAGFRFFLAGILVLLTAVASKKNILQLSKKNIGQLVLLGFSQTTLEYVFFYIGLAHTTGVKGSIMNGTGTFFSVILAHYIYKNDRLSLNKVLGCIVGFIGVMLVNFSTDLLNFSFSFNGEGFVIMSAFVLSAASIYGKKITQTLDSTVVTGYQLLIGGLFLTFIGYSYHGGLSYFTIKSASLLLYLAILSSTAFTLWTVLLKYNKVGTISAYNFLVPIFGSILSAIFLGESILQIKNLLALILVCLGIWMVNKERVPAMV